MSQEQKINPEISWQINTGYQNHTAVAGLVEGAIRLFVTGQKTGDKTASGKREGVVMCLDSAGRTVWLTELSHPGEDRSVGVFPSLLGDSDGDRMLFYVTGSGNNERPEPGFARLVSALDGTVVWETRTLSHHAGNGACIYSDIDSDGKNELIWWDSANIFCHRPPATDPLWVVSDNIATCHGRHALADIDGDGFDEIILGTEYAGIDGRSSMLAIDRKGKILWRRNGFEEDLGSTPTVIVDAANDGELKICKVGLDLVHRNNQQWSHLHAFGSDGTHIYSVPFGCGAMAVGDLMGDGRYVAVGITNARDGGCHGVSAIRCLRLDDGSPVWQREIDRVYLDGQDPVLADIDGDGLPEVVLTTGNPHGYGKIEDQDSYGDAYVVDRHGDILWHLTFPDCILAPLVTDLDGDGLNELVLPCGDGTITCFNTEGVAQSAEWPVAGGSYHRHYDSANIYGAA